MYCYLRQWPQPGVPDRAEQGYTRPPQSAQPPVAHTPPGTHPTWWSAPIRRRQRGGAHITSYIANKNRCFYWTNSGSSNLPVSLHFKMFLPTEDDPVFRKHTRGTLQQSYQVPLHRLRLHPRLEVVDGMKSLVLHQYQFRHYRLKPRLAKQHKRSGLGQNI